MWENGHRCRNHHKSLFEITVAIAGGTVMPQLSTGISSFVSALPRAIVGGLAGTIVFTLMMKFLAPAMIGHPDGHCGGARGVHRARYAGGCGHAFRARHPRLCNRVYNCRSLPAGSGFA